MTRERTRALCLVVGAAVLAVASAAALLALTPLTSPAVAKSYEITRCTIDAQVARSGDLTVEMRQTFDFDGDFTRVYWEIPRTFEGPPEILGVDGPGGPARLTGPGSDRPPGTYRVTDQGYTTLVETFFKLSDTEATFTLRYRALGAARRWQDTAELYWKFIAATWDVPMKDVRATVRLPAGVTRDQVKAWAHGPLWGVVSIEPDASVVMTVAPLPELTMLETRVTFPQSALPKAQMINAPRMELILAEEAERARQANEERDRARALERRQRWGVYAAVALALLVWVPFTVVYLKVGREYKPSLPGDYYRDIPPGMHPAVVAYVWKMGGFGHEAVTATIVDLANRGVLRIDPVTVTKDGLLRDKEERTYQLTVDTAKLEGLDELDQGLLRFLFNMIAADTTLTVPEMREFAKDHQKEFRVGLAAWQAAVKSRGEEMGVLEQRGQNAMGCMMGVGAVVFVGGIGLTVVFSTPWPLIVGLVSGIGVMIAARALKRRSRQAAELHAMYRGLRNYMRDFGRMQEKPPTAVVLWQQYLVLAIVFGIADEVIESMRVVVPEVVDDPAFRSTMWYMAAPGISGVSSFSSAFTSGFAAAATAASPKSSGSGGGGGFSGGGGGGGGGVGGGAD